MCVESGAQASLLLFELVALSALAVSWLVLRLRRASNPSNDESSTSSSTTSKKQQQQQQQQQQQSADLPLRVEE
jgi:hypothetical protein